MFGTRNSVFLTTIHFFRSLFFFLPLCRMLRTYVHLHIPLYIFFDASMGLYRYFLDREKKKKKCIDIHLYVYFHLPGTPFPLTERRSTRQQGEKTTTTTKKKVTRNEKNNNNKTPYSHDIYTL